MNLLMTFIQKNNAYRLPVSPPQQKNQYSLLSVGPQMLLFPCASSMHNTKTAFENLRLLSEPVYFSTCILR